MCVLTHNFLGNHRRRKPEANRHRLTSAMSSIGQTADWGVTFGTLFPFSVKGSRATPRGCQPAPLVLVNLITPAIFHDKKLVN